jgi:serine/threonine protein kinase
MNKPADVIRTREQLREQGRQRLRGLTGLRLADGWTIDRHVPQAAGLTGGHFSQSYHCRHDDGREGHLKAIDIHEALDHDDVLGALARLGDGANCEKELLEKAKRMDRVVTMFAHGEIRELNGEFLQIPIPYVIFERADGTVQRITQASTRPSFEWCLRTLHHVATGLFQLHNNDIAHQDLKQSNVLHFKGQTLNKLADLGRAVDRTRPVFYAEYAWSGDTSYAPPEVAYGFRQAEHNARRYASDMYLLGSFATSLFIGVSMNVILYNELHGQFKPRYFKGPYDGNFDDVAAHLQDAHDRAIAAVSGCLPATMPYRDELVLFVRQWTEPDPRRRGHPIAHRLNANGGNVYDLARYLSALANMVPRAAAFDRTLRA